MIAGLAIGGASTIVVSQDIYTVGLSAGWYDVVWAFGALFVGLFLADKTRKSKFKTINQMNGILFGEKFQAISVIIQFGINLVIVALQIVGGAAILMALLPQYFTMEIGLAVSALVFFAIAIIGGLWAADVSTATGLMVALGTMGTQDIVVKYFRPDMSDEQQLKLSKAIITVSALVVYILATKVSSVLGTLMSALTLFAPYAILMTAVFLFPNAVKQSSGWITFLAGFIAFILSQFDKRQAPIDELFVKEEASQDN